MALSPQETNLFKIVTEINEIRKGRSDATGTVTLTAGAASTMVDAVNCAEGSIPVLVPMSATAATEQGAGTMYVSAVANGSFTIAHANSAVATRTFGWHAVG